MKKQRLYIRCDALDICTQAPCGEALILAERVSERDDRRIVASLDDLLAWCRYGCFDYCPRHNQERMEELGRLRAEKEGGK